MGMFFGHNKNKGGSYEIFLTNDTYLLKYNIITNEAQIIFTTLSPTAGNQVLLMGKDKFWFGKFISGTGTIFYEFLRSNNQYVRQILQTTDGSVVLGGCVQPSPPYTDTLFLVSSTRNIADHMELCNYDIFSSTAIINTKFYVYISSVERINHVIINSKNGNIIVNRINTGTFENILTEYSSNGTLIKSISLGVITNTVGIVQYGYSLYVFTTTFLIYRVTSSGKVLFRDNSASPLVSGSNQLWNAAQPLDTVTIGLP